MVRKVFSYELTSREKEVFEYAFAGYTDVEIAEFLGIERTTVKSHMRYVRKKLSVNNRRTAFYKALQMGILESPQCNT